jgi:hypothetical protein
VLVIEREDIGHDREPIGLQPAPPRGCAPLAARGPGRATTATSTGGTAGGRCWRGLGGREQPSLTLTLCGHLGHHNDVRMDPAI